MTLARFSAQHARPTVQRWRDGSVFDVVHPSGRMLTPLRDVFTVAENVSHSRRSVHWGHIVKG